MEELLKKNTYIEGLLTVINVAAPISQDLAFDLLMDLYDNLLMTGGLFVAAKVGPDTDEEFQDLNVFRITSTDGKTCVPVFTNPELMRDFMDDRTELRPDDPPFAIMNFPQIYEMAKNLPEGTTGIVLNPEEESERVLTIEQMLEVLTGSFEDDMD